MFARKPCSSHTDFTMEKAWFRRLARPSSFTMMLACTAIKKAVEHDLIRSQFSIFLHVSQKLHALVHITCSTESFDHCAVGDNVRFDRRCGTSHVLKKLWDFVHVPTLRECIEHCVVCNCVARDTLCPHFLVQGHQTI